MRTIQNRQLVGERDGISGLRTPSGIKNLTGPISGFGKTDSIDILPNHSTATPYRHAAVMQMQRNYGNAYVQRQLGSGQNHTTWHQDSSGKDDGLDRSNQGDNRDEELLNRLQNAMTGGELLPANIRLELEKGLGADLGHVRIHDDNEADDLSRSFEAAAFTNGSDIFFRNGAYKPNADEGFHLLAHEATHVVQQRQSPLANLPGGSGPLAISQPLDHAETEASASADRISAGKTANVQSTPSATVAREEESWLDTLLAVGGQIGNVSSLGGGLLQGVDDIGTSIAGLTPASQYASGIGRLGSGLGVLGSGLGLITGTATALDESQSTLDRIVGGASATSGGLGLLGTMFPSLAAGGSAGLGATAMGSGALGSAGAFGTAGAALGSVGAVLGAGAAGYGIGTLIAENTGIDEAIGEGLFDLLGPGPGLWLADKFGI